MAGIGFELRRLLRRDSLLGTLQAYAYAGIIASGPWVLSIVAVLLIGLLSLAGARSKFVITQFQVTITYIIAFSLMLTGALQLVFTRYTADRLFEKQDSVVLPNFNGALLLTTGVSGAISIGVIVLTFAGTDILYRMLVVSSFVIVSDIWIGTIFLAGAKQYKAIVALFALGYGITVCCALALERLGLAGLLGGFIAGQAVILFGLVLVVFHQYPSSRMVDFDFMRKGRFYPSLIGVGLLYNLSLWIDKLMFWFYGPTSQAIIGPLRASLIYDIPVFMGYLSIIPGMAVYLIKVETDFVQCHEGFYNAVRLGGSLRQIETWRTKMIASARGSISQIIKIQSITALLVFAMAPAIVDSLGISRLYLPLLFVNLVSAGLQVVFLATINVFFYLDQRIVVLALTALFVLSNGLFTLATLVFGPLFYGYGFASALLLTVMTGFYVLSRKFESLEYHTFMLQ